MIRDIVDDVCDRIQNGLVDEDAARELTVSVRLNPKGQDTIHPSCSIPHTAQKIPVDPHFLPLRPLGPTRTNRDPASITRLL